MSQNARRGRDSSPLFLLIRYNIDTPWITTCTIQTNGNHRHSLIPIPTLGHVLVHSVGKIHVLVVATDLVVVFEYIFLNFVSTPNKSLRFTRFRGSYVNCNAIVLTSNCSNQSYTAFLLDVLCSKWARSLFCRCLSPMIVHFRKLSLLSTHFARMLLTRSWVNTDEKMWNNYP